MSKNYIIEVAKAYKIQANTEEEAWNKFSSLNDEEFERAHENAGYWQEVTNVYLAEDSE